MKITIHQTHHTIADFDGILDYLEEHFSNENPGIHLFPELFLTGYPLQDLCLSKSFIDSYLAFLEELKTKIQKFNLKNTWLLMGALEYELTQSGIPKHIKNVVMQFSQEENGKILYTKRLLPNYDIFDEQKYFTRGHTNSIITIEDKSYGLLICEDMWVSSFHDTDPVAELKDFATTNNIELDGIFNFSASPYVLDKQKSRLERGHEISQYFGCPFYYVNRVGSEDEILFDGQSFVVNDGEVCALGKKFAADIINLPLLPKKNAKPLEDLKQSITWEELFKASLNSQHCPPIIDRWNDEQCLEVINAICFGFQEYAKKNGFKKFSVALSGGMDSALVLTLISLSLKPGQSVEAIFMPSIHSSGLSFDLSIELCQKLQVPFTSMPIKFLHSTAKNLFEQNFNEEFAGLTDENIQSRLRGLLIYTRSNQLGSMVINTSNKSEIAVGYSTQYGDSVGAISMLGDIYKSQVYRLAEYINEKFNGLIPEQIITRPPSAELKEGQADTDSLPPYVVLDAILEGILSYRYTAKDLIQLGFHEEDVKKTFQMYSRNEYKRYQFCPIIKISSKSFGFGYRIPLSKSSSFYNRS